MPTRSSLACFAATIATGIVLFAFADKAYAHSGGGGGGASQKHEANFVTKTGIPASGGNTQGGGSRSCKGPACDVKAPTGGLHCQPLHVGHGAGGAANNGC